MTRDGGAGRVYDCAVAVVGRGGRLISEPEPVMTVARSVADVLSEHVRFEVECIDRMYLNVYQPKLQYAPGLVGYVHRQLGLPIASTAPLAKITDRFVAAVQRFAARLAAVDFAAAAAAWIDRVSTPASPAH